MDKGFIRGRCLPSVNPSNGDTRLVEHEFDWGETSPSVAVVYTLASLENRDTADGPPLYEYVDPESLDTLVAESGDVSVTFPVRGYVVGIRGSTVAVTRAVC
nr:HalOD1 output domain-containing protein [Saliphagus sp. LR7]